MFYEPCFMSWLLDVIMKENETIKFFIFVY